MSKPKFAMYWAASCGGCEIAVLNIHEKILDVDANFDVVFWPVAMDAKYKDVEAMEDGSILLTLWNGGIRNDENERTLAALRKSLTLTTKPSLRIIRSISALSRTFRCLKVISPSQPSTRFYGPSTRSWTWITTCPAARPNRTRSLR